MNEEREEAGAARLGWLVFAALAVLTAVEYIVAAEVGRNLVPLLVIAVVKASAIAWYFMHIVALWRAPEEGH
jgi:hypothetical protein